MFDEINFTQATLSLFPRSPSPISKPPLLAQQLVSPQSRFSPFLYPTPAQQATQKKESTVNLQNNYSSTDKKMTDIFSFHFPDPERYEEDTPPLLAGIAPKPFPSFHEPLLPPPLHHYPLDCTQLNSPPSPEQEENSKDFDDSFHLPPLTTKKQTNFNPFSFSLQPLSSPPLHHHFAHAVNQLNSPPSPEQKENPTNFDNSFYLSSSAITQQTTAFKHYLSFDDFAAPPPRPSKKQRFEENEIDYPKSLEQFNPVEKLKTCPNTPRRISREPLTQLPLWTQNALKLSSMSIEGITEHLNKTTGKTFEYIETLGEGNIVTAYLFKVEGSPIVVKIPHFKKIKNRGEAFIMAFQEIKDYIAIRDIFPASRYQNLDRFVSEENKIYLDKEKLKNDFTEGYYLAEYIPNDYQIPDSDEEIDRQMNDKTSPLYQLKQMFSLAFKMKRAVDLKKDNIKIKDDGTVTLIDLYPLDQSFGNQNPFVPLIDGLIRSFTETNSKIRDFLDPRIE